MQVDYLALPADHPLAGSVVSIFRLRAAGAFTTETILPKNIVDILFNLGPAIRLTGYAPRPCEWRSTLVSGVRTGAVVSQPDRTIFTMGISLRPEAAFSILRVRLDELKNGSVDGSTLFREADSLLNRLGETPAFPQQCRMLLDWVASRLAADDDRRLVGRACRVLRQTPGAGDVAQAAAAVGVSPRHLQRLFMQRIGLSPARYIQLARFASALPLISTRRTLTAVAAEAGYFDHAHFCRDFRMFAGMTPDDYRQTGPFVPGHIFAP